MTQQIFLPSKVLTLALAMIESSSSPLVLLDGAQIIVAASTSFCQAFEIDPATVMGLKLQALGTGEWAVPQLESLLDATLSGFADIDAYEMELKREGKQVRRLVLNAHKLDYDNNTDVRLLLAVVDVTDQRAETKLKDDLLREKAILLQELQHRVANSLQIVASVLMQSARRVQSGETRSHLADAHSRIMSIATLQQQLATSRIGDVPLRAYFKSLCQTLGASMIHDSTLISIKVEVDESVSGADASVSMGLIITELVINALKHAFPNNGQVGQIKVGYHATGARWALSVDDDGVGMQTNAAPTATGLGTSLVTALANQLNATVHVESGNPGTVVWIVHED